jgi:hypothetical protein
MKGVWQNERKGIKAGALQATIERWERIFWRRTAERRELEKRNPACSI